MSIESKIAVLPAGEMGTALATKAFKKANPTSLWFHSQESYNYFLDNNESPRLKGIKLGGINCTLNMQQALEGAEAIFFSPRSSNFREVLKSARQYIREDAILISGTKGFSEYNGEICTFSQVIEQEIPGSKNRIAVLSGPNFADQIARDKITGTTVAAHNLEIAQRARDVFHNGVFQIDVYKGNPKDVEIVGAYKNVVALVMGFARTLDNYDENTGALILQKGLSEAAMLLKAMGGDPSAIMELCGVGDYALLINSTTSRNVQAGEAFGRGEVTLDELMNSSTTYEGISASEKIRLLFRRHKVFLPLGLSAYRVLHNHRDPKYAVRRLLEVA